MKLIHLSDTHIGREGNVERMDRLVQDIIALGNPQDYIVIHTGDLNDRGTADVMQLGRQALDTLTRAGWRVVLSPGNHDYGDSLHVDPQWAQLFRDTFSVYIFGQQAKQFPVLTLTDDCALIGLDSNEAEMGLLDRLFAEGWLGDRQISALNTMLDRPDVRQRKVVLYLHHHPFFDAFAVRADVGDHGYLSHAFGWNTRRFRRLKDAYTLMQCIRDRVDVMLFGHQHYGLDYSAEGQRYGVRMALDASSSTCTQMDTDRMRYRIIDTATLSFETRFVALP